MTTATRAAKEVTVLHVYKFNHIARICFEIESSDGLQKYNTCFNHDAQHGNCTCDGNAQFHKDCYHLKNLRSRAQAYFDSRKPVAPASSSVAILTPEGISVIDKSEVTEHDILAEEDETPGLDAAEAYIASLKAQVQQEDWHETAQFGAQDHKTEVAPSGRLVPMR